MNISRNHFFRAISITALTPLVLFAGLVVLVHAAVFTLASLASRLRSRVARQNPVRTPDENAWVYAVNDPRLGSPSPDPSSAQAAQPNPKPDATTSVSTPTPSPNHSPESRPSLLSKPHAKSRRHL